MNKDQKSQIVVYVVINRDKEQRFSAKFAAFPEVGDTVALVDKGIYAVVERGHVVGSGKAGALWIAVSELDAGNVAPSRQYDFLYDFE